LAETSLGFESAAARLVSRHAATSHRFVLAAKRELLRQGGRSGHPETIRVESLVDPHASMRMKRNLTEGWFFGILPDMNTENPLVEQYLLQNSIWWAEISGLDGYRIDTFPMSDGSSGQLACGIAQALSLYDYDGEVFHPDPSVTSFLWAG